MGRKAASCADCLAWGVLNGRRCGSCSVWRHKHPGEAECVLNGAEDSHGFGVFAAFIVPTGDGGEMAWSAAAPRR